MRFSRHSESKRAVRPRRLLEQLEQRLLFSASPIGVMPLLDQIEGLLAELSPEFPTSTSEVCPVEAPRSQLGSDQLQDDGVDAPMALVVYAGESRSVEARAWLQLESETLNRWHSELPMETEWSLLSGPGGVVFNDPTAVDPLVKFDLAGTYFVQVSAVHSGVTLEEEFRVEVSPDVTAPTITNRTPGPSATGVGLNSTVNVTFSEGMNAATINTSTVRLRAAGASSDVTATVSYSGTTATLTPSSGLSGSTTYQVTVAGSVADSSGNGLGTASTWSFTTLNADTTAPTITNRTPASGATGVALGTAVSITFSEAMNAATITSSSVRLRAAGASSDVAATVTYSGTTATLQATSSLVASTTYQVTVAGTVTDVAGNALGSASTWSFTTIPSAANIINIDQAWLAAQGAGPYYLDQQGKTYVLQTDVTTDGTAFVIIDDNITFDLNGHTVTYDQSTPITVFNASFENGSGPTADGWDFTDSPNAERFKGVYLNNEIYDGEYSLRFANFSGQQTVESGETITLEANTTYSLSSMFRQVNSDTGVSTFVRLDGVNVASTHQVTFNSTSFSRGIQFTEVTFTTGDTEETYRAVVGAINANSDADAVVYVDDIRIQRHRNFGILVSPSQNFPQWYPNVNRFGSGVNAEIRNGTLTQGSGAATLGHGVWARAADGLSLHDMTITVYGANSSNLEGSYADQVTVFNNVFHNHVKTIFKRDSFDGSVILWASGEFYGNTITSGVHSGIVTPGDSVNNIHHNTITLQTKYTNAFAVFLKNDGGSQVHHNTIDSGDGNNSSRGIGMSVSTAATPTRIFDNQIAVQELARNQEYGGAVLGGAYGVQIEKRSNVEMFGNTITVYSREAEAYGIRHNGDSTNHYIHDNTIRAYKLGALDAAALYLKNLNQDSQLRFENNTVVTNHQWLGGVQSVSNVALTGNTWKAEGDLSNFEGFEVYESNASHVSRDIRFVDNKYFDAESKSRFDTMVVSNDLHWITPTSSFMTLWTTTFNVINSSNVGVANAAIIVRNQVNEIVYQGSTNASGVLSTTLIEYRVDGTTRTRPGPYTVFVSAGGQQSQLEFSADRKQIIEVVLNM